ncbi:MAG: hypothetical protein K6F75_14035 [Butyrivibrio sp.]|nr:hypothetical protein [Butyrivibrio sp.]
MKRFVGLSLMFAGLVFVIFIVNLFLYSFNSEYHAALRGAVTGEEDEIIPVVDVNKDLELSTDNENVINKSVIYDELQEEEVPLSAVYDNSDEEESQEEFFPVIVDKEYHEDCGTGEGYWIIRYEDGTVVVEQ